MFEDPKSSDNPRTPGEYPEILGGRDMSQALAALRRQAGSMETLFQAEDAQNADKAARSLYLKVSQLFPQDSTISLGFKSKALGCMFNTDFDEDILLHLLDYFQSLEKALESKTINSSQFFSEACETACEIARRYAVRSSLEEVSAAGLSASALWIDKAQNMIRQLKKLDGFGSDKKVLTEELQLLVATGALEFHGDKFEDAARTLYKAESMAGWLKDRADTSTLGFMYHYMGVTASQRGYRDSAKKYSVQAIKYFNTSHQLTLIAVELAEKASILFSLAAEETNPEDKAKLLRSSCRDIDKAEEFFSKFFSRSHPLALEMERRQISIHSAQGCLNEVQKSEVCDRALEKLKPLAKIASQAEAGDLRLRFSLLHSIAAQYIDKLEAPSLTKKQKNDIRRQTAETLLAILNDYPKNHPGQKLAKLGALPGLAIICRDESSQKTGSDREQLIEAAYNFLRRTNSLTTEIYGARSQRAEEIARSIISFCSQEIRSENDRWHQRTKMWTDVLGHIRG